MEKQKMLGRALIKFSESEIDLLLTALYNTEKLNIPRINPKWKKPFSKLIRDLIFIKESIEKEKETIS